MIQTYVQKRNFNILCTPIILKMYWNTYKNQQDRNYGTDEVLYDFGKSSSHLNILNY